MLIFNGRQNDRVIQCLSMSGLKNVWVAKLLGGKMSEWQNYGQQTLCFQMVGVQMFVNHLYYSFCFHHTYGLQASLLHTHKKTAYKIHSIS